MTEVNAFLRFPDNVSFSNIAEILSKEGVSLDIVVGDDLSNELNDEQVKQLDKSLSQADSGQTLSVEECRKEIEDMYADF